MLRYPIIKKEVGGDRKVQGKIIYIEKHLDNFNAAPFPFFIVITNITSKIIPHIQDGAVPRPYNKNISKH